MYNIHSDYSHTSRMIYTSSAETIL